MTISASKTTVTISVKQWRHGRMSWRRGKCPIKFFGCLKNVVKSSSCQKISVQKCQIWA